MDVKLQLRNRVMGGVVLDHRQNSLQTAFFSRGKFLKKLSHAMRPSLLLLLHCQELSPGFVVMFLTFFLQGVREYRTR